MKPDGERSGYFQAIQSFFVPGFELMGGAVAFNPKRMEQFGDVGVEADFPIQFEQQIGLGGFFIEFDAATRRKMLSQSFA